MQMFFKGFETQCIGMDFWISSKDQQTCSMLSFYVIHASVGSIRNEGAASYFFESRFSKACRLKPSLLTPVKTCARGGSYIWFINYFDTLRFRLRILEL